jgi:hypothetical protein
MSTAINPVGMKLTSNPAAKRALAATLAVGVGLGWVFMTIWLIVAWVAFTNNLIWGCVLFAAVAAFAIVLSTLTYTSVHRICRDYVFELTVNDAVLIVIDRLSKRQSTEMVVMDDIKFAEYYPYPDSACIILHTSYAKMEVPLWPMIHGGGDVLDFLKGRGIRVVNVESDELIPD